MAEGTFDEYLSTRLEPTHRWLGQRAVFHKRLTFLLHVPIIAMAAVVPVFAALDMKLTTIILSSSIAAGLGILKFGKSEELWHNYRLTERDLQRERVLFENRIGEYESSAHPEKLFIARSESIITREYRQWARFVEEGGQISLD